MVFPVVMYGCESWTVKKAEHQRIDAFELWCWRRLESPLDCKEIRTVEVAVHGSPTAEQPAQSEADAEDDRQLLAGALRLFDDHHGVLAGGAGDGRDAALRRCG